MSTQRSALTLFEGSQQSGMTPAELRIKYYAVGGDAAELERSRPTCLACSARTTTSTISSPKPSMSTSSTATKTIPCVTATFPGGKGARPAGIAGLSYWPGPGEPISSPVSTR
jgi:hypothetical protein